MGNKQTERSKSEKTSQRQTDNRIAENVNKWVQGYNRKCPNSKKIHDYGQVHFSENDRKSWYIRFPFDVPNTFDSYQLTSTTNKLSGQHICDDHHYDNIPNIMQTPSSVIEQLVTQLICPPPSTPSTVDIKPETELIEFMREQWELPLPELIISVTGGAKLFTPRVRRAFQEGLVSAAVTTDAWVFTGGTYSGIMKEVGDAFEKWTYKTNKRHAKVPVIAIGNWHYMTDHEQLIQQSLQTDNNSSEMQINMSDQAADYERLYRIRFPTQDEPESWPMDPNHTHFILLDDMCGSNDNQWKTRNYPIQSDLDVQLGFRIEQAARLILNHGLWYEIPIVQLLVNGGPLSLLNVCEAVKHEIPVIVIQNTGRAADFIADTYHALYKNQKNVLESSYDESEINKLIDRGKNELIINEMNEKLFRDMITSRDGFLLIHIISLDVDDSQLKLGDAIFEALFRRTTTNKSKISDVHVQKLKLAMAWKKFDLVVSDILNKNRKIQWTDVELDHALNDALRHDSVQFVELLLEQGASIDRLRRMIKINDLYKTKTGSLLPHQGDIMLDDIRRTYYKEYLDEKAVKTTESYQREILFQTSTIYGSIVGRCNEDITLNEKVVFNENDAVRCNGYVIQVIIAFSQRLDVTKSPCDLYIISPTMPSGSFQVIGQHRINQEIKDRNLNELRIDLPDSTIYLESGQYLAVAFKKRNTATPKCFNGPNSYYSFDLEATKKSYSNNRTIIFEKYDGLSVAISFRLVPTSEYIRDVFLWSVFLARYNFAVCLCSHSPNTTVAALLASKIYQTAVQLSNDIEQKEEYARKGKEFDLHAARIIDKCFIQNEQLALQILTTKSKLYFDYSPLSLATEANSRSFLATKCVQKYLDQLWYGNIVQHGHHQIYMNIMIFLLCIFPFLIPFPCFYSIFKSSSTKKEVNIDENKIKKCFIFNRLKDFYHGRAIVRFSYNIIFYVIFLGLFSFIMLVDYFPLNNNGGRRNGFPIGIPVTEIIFHICQWSLIVEEIREFEIYRRKKMTSNTRKRYILVSYLLDNQWNILDFMAILVYLIGFSTRFFVVQSIFVVSKIFMCIGLFLWYVRILQLFAASKRFGPKLLMIFNTMKDLVFFICFILIFLLGYSISSYALITTKDQIIWFSTNESLPSNNYNLTQNGSGLWKWSLFRDVIDWGIWKIFGQVELIDHTQLSSTTNLTAADDAYGNTVFVLTIIFVCVASVLLLNVLVALFNVTLAKVGQNVHDAWAYHRFLLVQEYSAKSPLPPPMNLFYYGYKFFQLPLQVLQRNKADTIGCLNGSSNLDANVLNMIVFNATHRVIRNGRLYKIAINFCRAPRRNDAIIELYSITESPSDLNHFFVKQFDTIITNLKLSKGIQNVTIKEIPVQQGEYIGLRFGTDAGSPFTIECTSYYTKHTIENTEQEHKILFTQCINHGISVRFYIKNHPDKQKYNRRKIIEKTAEEKPLVQVDQHAIKAKQKSLKTIDNLTKFQERDNMLRESSIAQDYWQRELKHIIEQERDEVDREKKSQVMHEQERIQLHKQQEELIQQLNTVIEKLSRRSSIPTAI